MRPNLLNGPAGGPICLCQCNKHCWNQTPPVLSELLLNLWAENLLIWGKSSRWSRDLIPEDTELVRHMSDISSESWEVQLWRGRQSIRGPPSGFLRRTRWHSDEFKHPRSSLCLPVTVSGVKRWNWPLSRAPVTAPGPLTDCNNSFVTLVTQRDKAYMTIEGLYLVTRRLSWPRECGREGGHENWERESINIIIISEDIKVCVPVSRWVSRSEWWDEHSGASPGALGCHERCWDQVRDIRWLTVAIIADLLRLICHNLVLNMSLFVFAAPGLRDAVFGPGNFKTMGQWPCKILNIDVTPCWVSVFIIKNDTWG